MGRWLCWNGFHVKESQVTQSSSHFGFLYFIFSNSVACCTSLLDTNPGVRMGTGAVCL